MLFGRKGPAGPEPRTRKETTHSADKIAWEKQPRKPPRGIFFEFFCKNIPPRGLIFIHSADYNRGQPQRRRTESRIG